MSQTSAVVTTATLVVIAALASALVGAQAYIYQPGEVFEGHRRFMDACEACHDPFKGPNPGKCASCHAILVKHNTHSDKKLEAPLRVDVDEKYRSFTCISCHREHQGEDMPKTKYTGPPGMCQDCHPNTDLRSDHKEYPQDSCSQETCHSYHFNISRDMFGENAKARLLDKTTKPGKMPLIKDKGITAEALAAMRTSEFYQENPAIAAKHAISPHNSTSATCQRCHTDSGGTHVRKPPVSVCAECHAAEYFGFSSGTHGAAEARGRGRFTTKRDRVVCGVCHDTHSQSLTFAGKVACQACHVNTHALNYEKSGHFRYLSDPVFAFKPVAGVDCAGCHMPKLDELSGHTIHNESFTISNKLVMARVVCIRCHGMKFSLESLYDSRMISYNFSIAGKKETPEGLEGHFKANRVK